MRNLERFVQPGRGWQKSPGSLYRRGNLASKKQTDPATRRTSARPSYVSSPNVDPTQVISGAVTFRRRSRPPQVGDRDLCKDSLQQRLPCGFCLVATCCATFTGLGEKVRVVGCGDMWGQLTGGTFCGERSSNLHDFFKLLGQYGVSDKGGVELVGDLEILGHQS